VTSLSSPPFVNAPLALTVLEIRYPELPDGVGRRTQAKLRDALRSHLPLVENMTEEQIEVALGAPMPAAVQRRTFPRFVSRDRTTALVVKESALVVETTTYGGWHESFRPLIVDVIGSLVQACRPDGVLRVGLRYIDEIRVPGIDSVPGDWRGYIDEHLLAAADPGFIPDILRPTVWQGIVRYRSSDASTLTVRYGPQLGHAVDPRGATRRKNAPPAGPFFLLDSDSAWEASDDVPEFSTEAIAGICDELHEPTKAFFQIAVTDKLRDEVFGGRKGSR
jgi:uncharacterized protein (TIGR04255 family)